MTTLNDNFTLWRKWRELDAQVRRKKFIANGLGSEALPIAAPFWAQCLLEVTTARNEVWQQIQQAAGKQEL